MHSNVITLQTIRTFMRDSPQNNVLLDDFDYTQEEIDLAIDLMLTHYNSLPPASNLKVNDIQANVVTLFIYGVCMILSDMEMFKQLRNQVSYNDGGITVGIDDKFQLYMQQSQFFMQKFDTLAKQYKYQKNAEDLLSGIDSAYDWLTQW